MRLNSKLNARAAYVPFQRKRSSQNVVQISDEFNSDFDDDFAVHSLCSCGPGALVLPFMLVQTRNVWCRVAVSARAGNERLVLPFMLVQTKSVWCRLLCSCGSGALMLPFMLVQTRSFVPCSLDSCGQ
ncbi:hypothetical protein ACFX2J_046044 [Malus domestica]